MINVAHQMRGQAMTEFVVSAAFVLVPLFIIIPIIGKYVDMKHMAIQAARYEAWEYTVNYQDIDDEQPSNFTSVAPSKLPEKSLSRVQRESRRRLFSRPGIELDSGVDASGFDAADINPLWRYHDGTDMYDPVAIDTVSEMRQESTPPGGVLGDILNVIEIIFGAMADIVSTVSKLIGAPPIGFDAIKTHGYFKSTVSVPVEGPPEYTAFSLANTAPLFITERHLKMTAQSSILSNAWNAGGAAHTASQAKGLVPTALIGNILNHPLPLQDVVSAVLLSPELSSGSLKFGYMNNDAVPASKLEGGGDASCNDGGYCQF